MKQFGLLSAKALADLEALADRLRAEGPPDSLVALQEAEDAFRSDPRRETADEYLAKAEAFFGDSAEFALRKDDVDCVLGPVAERMETAVDLVASATSADVAETAAVLAIENAERFLGKGDPRVRELRAALDDLLEPPAEGSE